jgi:7 transmembrane receptor (rhodopsin family)
VSTGSTSIWLTVSFTVERYIAVCHPMRGKMLCTESRARRVTALVYILCFASTLSTPFEWQTVRKPLNPDFNATNLNGTLQEVVSFYLKMIMYCNFKYCAGNIFMKF